MPIVVDLDVELAQRRMTLSELSARVGVTVANLSVLKNGRARAVRFSTLEALCAALGCQPGDLLRWVPEPAVEEAPGPGERTTSGLDDALVAEAQRLTGMAEESALVHEALRALVERESARRLARLGGSEPDLIAAPRRRTPGQ